MHKARYSSSKDENEHHTYPENTIAHETEREKVDGLSKDAISRLKQLKSPARGRQASWETLYTHFFPGASPIPDPYKGLYFHDQLTSWVNDSQANGTTGFENESKGSTIEDEADLHTKVERFLLQEIAASIKTREDIIECLRERLLERLRNEQISAEPELVSESEPTARVLSAAEKPER